jgi:hypothetical protein
VITDPDMERGNTPLAVPRQDGLLPHLNVFVKRDNGLVSYTVREVRIRDMFVLPTSDCLLCSDGRLGGCHSPSCRSSYQSGCRDAGKLIVLKTVKPMNEWNDCSTPQWRYSIWLWIRTYFFTTSTRYSSLWPTLNTTCHLLYK